MTTSRTTTFAVRVPDDVFDVFSTYAQTHRRLLKDAVGTLLTDVITILSNPRFRDLLSALENPND